MLKYDVTPAPVAHTAAATKAYRYNLGMAYAGVALAHADRAALRFGADTVVTHGELNRLCNQLAAVLAARGIVRGDVVAIVHTKTNLCFAAMLSCLKLGAVYVNLDDQNPPARLTHIVNSARPKIVLGDDLPPRVAETLRSLGVRILDLRLDGARGEIAAAPITEPTQTNAVTGSDPAYIMFTSGSTGIPKGAIITHANVLNFGAWTAARFDITPADTLTNLNPMYFDNSVFDLYAALLNGAALAPIARGLLANPPAMLAQLEAAGCTVWFSVPSLLVYLTTLKLLSTHRLQAVRAFAFGGEGYPKPELRKLFGLFGHRSRLINVYGPTECTCICSAWDVTADDFNEPEGFITLGPIAGNFSTLILDAEQRPVAAGETGELYLLGPQVGLGYVNDGERTASSFLANPANAGWPERMYRTGDLVKQQRAGGAIDFVGRADNQIKHMGYRIELEEIETALQRIAGVIQAAVLQTTSGGHKKIVAHLATERDLSDTYLRRELAVALPPYMLPERFIQTRSLTKNANGKIDRLALVNEC